MTETGGPRVEPVKQPDPRITEPPAVKKSLLNFPRDRVAHAMSDLSLGPNGESEYKKVDKRVRRVFENVTKALQSDPNETMMNNGGFFKLAYGYLEAAHDLNQSVKNLSGIFNIADTDRSREKYPSHYQREKFYDDDFASEMMHNIVRTLTNIPEGVRSMDDVRRLANSPDDTNLQVQRARGFVYGREISVDILSKGKSSTLDLMAPKIRRANQSAEEEIIKYVESGGTAQLMRDTLLKAEAKLLEQLEGTPATETPDAPLSDQVDQTSLPSESEKTWREQLKQYSFKDVLDALAADYPDDLKKFQETLPQQVQSYFYNCTHNGNEPDDRNDFYIFRWNDDWEDPLAKISIATVYKRTGLPMIAYMDATHEGPTDAEQPLLKVAELILLDAYRNAALLPDGFDAAKNVPKLKNESEEHKKFRRNVGNMKKYIHIRADVDRFNENSRKLDAGEELDPEERSFMKIISARMMRPNIAGYILGALDKGAKAEPPLTKEMMREAGQKAGEWLLDLLQRPRVDSGSSVLDPVAEPERVPHPTDIVSLGESPSREFTPDIPPRMEEYQQIIKHFTDNGYRAAYSKGKIARGDEHGIRLSDGNGNGGSRQLSDAVKPVNTSEFDIARLVRPEDEHTMFEIENPPTVGACYVIHPGIKQFWQQVYGSNISFAEITHKQSLLTRRLLGAYAFDHKGPWHQKVIDFLEDRQGYDVLETVLGTWFNEGYLGFENGKLTSQVIHARSHSGDSEWDQQVPDNIFMALGHWLDRPEQAEVKDLLRKKETMQAAKKILGHSDLRK